MLNRGYWISFLDPLTCYAVLYFYRPCRAGVAIACLPAILSLGYPTPRNPISTHVVRIRCTTHSLRTIWAPWEYDAHHLGWRRVALHYSTTPFFFFTFLIFFPSFHISSYLFCFNFCFCVLLISLFFTSWQPSCGPAASSGR